MKILFFISVITFTTISYSATSPKCPGEEGEYFINYKHRANSTAGGFVAKTAFADDQSEDLYVAPSAAICGFASVEGRASIRGNSLIRGNSRITDSVIIQGNIIVDGNSEISGSARIMGNGIVSSLILRDEVRILNGADPFEVRAPILTAQQLAVKVYEFVSTKAERFTPGSGLNMYDGTTEIVQKIEFNGTCGVKLIKTRFCARDQYGNGCRSFHMNLETTFNLKDIPSNGVESIFYSPTVSAVDLSMVEFEKKVSRRYQLYQNSIQPPWMTGFGNKHDTKYTTSFASIETKTLEDAQALTELLKKLVQACK